LLLTLGAGALFGIWKGFICVSIGSTIGATAAFVLGRGFLRSWISKKIEKYPKFQAIDKAIGHEGLKLVFLLRLSPIIPFNILNYALGLSTIPLLQYFFASWIGMIPGTFMYIYIGVAVGNLADIFAGNTNKDNTLQLVYLIIGLVATLIAVIIISIIAKRAIKKAIEEDTSKNIINVENTESTEQYGPIKFE